MAAENEVTLSFSDKLNNQLTSVSEALPKDFNKSRFVQNALAVLNDDEKLRKVSTPQLIGGLMKGAYLGLDFFNKECYLIPYGNGVQFQTDYKGEIKFTKKYSIRKIKDIYAKCVREGDEFEEIIVNGEPSINFKPVPFSNKDIVGVFAVVLYTDGGMEYETMSTLEVNTVRNNYSKMANGNTWKKSWDEMAKKTVLRRLAKHIEIDFESTEALSAWEDGSDSQFNKVKNSEKKEDVVDVFATSSNEIITENGEVVVDAE